MNSIFTDPNAPIGGWLRDQQPKQSNDQEAPKQEKPDTRDTVTKAASHFHKKPEGGEPDWAGALLYAKNQTEKFKIRAARDAYNEEKRFQAFQRANEAHQAHIADVLRTPHRNKTFWDTLKQNDPKVFYSTEAQRQLKTDKGVMGLAFHLKGNK